MENSTILQLLQEGNKSSEWYAYNVQKLKNKYDNQFVAIQDRKVIASDKSMEGLRKQLADINVNICHVLVKFVSKVKAIL